MLLRDCRHVTSLIFSDLRFEWILSVCMVLALGAVFAPLFILLGLQEGIVGNMLDKLRSDPASCLVTPKFPLEAPLDDVWLRALGERSKVVITSSTSHLLLNVDGLDNWVNAVPTGPADPLLVENGIALSGEGWQIVLSERLAQLMGKKTGDSFGVTLIRKTGQEERLPIKFQVAGTLPKSASEDVKIWLPVTLFQGFDRWRKGHSVPDLGLAGRDAVLTPEYDGVLTLLKHVPTDEEYRRMLAGKMSFSQHPEAIAETGCKIPHDRRVQLWRPVNNRIFEADLPPLVNRHNELGYSVDVVPFLDAFEVTLVSGDRSARLSLTVLPTVPEDTTVDQEGVHCVWVSPDDDFKACAPGEMSFKSGNQEKGITIPVRVCPSSLVTPGYLAVPRDLAGKMNAARHQEVIYDPATGELSCAGEGIRFFRAYAKSIDKLEDLVEFVRKEGERRVNNALREPSSRVGEVRNIRRLAGYMEKLYRLIVLVSGVAGFFAIAASVYAGIQRKRHDLAYLQMLGLHPYALFLFPYLKSLALVAGGVFVALIAYVFFGYFSTRLFPLDAASLTHLTLSNISILVTVILVAASVASLLAATAVTKIDPGEYIRE